MPNYTNAFNAAYEAVYNYSPRELPIDLERLVSKLKVMKLCSYSRMSGSRKISFSETLEYLGSGLGTLARRGNKYIIYYNDRKRSPYLDRFTIAHELGHFFLNHLEEGEMLNGSLDATQHDIFEKEANCFARNLLSPVLLVDSILDNTEPTKENIDTLSRYFAISKAAARTRLAMYPFDKVRLKEYHGDSWENFTYTPWKFCRKCGNITLSEGFCEICGQSLSGYRGSIHPNALIKTSAHMYNSPADISCINCGENLHLPYESSCTACGYDMSNFCLNKPGLHDSPVYLDNLSARYCPHCGGESVYKAQGFLKPYNKEAPQIMDRIVFLKGRQEYLRKTAPKGLVHEIKTNRMEILNFD